MINDNIQLPQMAYYVLNSAMKQNDYSNISNEEFIPSSPSSYNSPSSKNVDYKNEDSLHKTTKRKFFTQYEDQLLTDAVFQYKHESWNEISLHVPGRTPKQCRDRWVNYLQPSLKFHPWDLEDDQLLVTLVNKYGTHWSKMKAYFPERSSNALKNRWYSLIRVQVKEISKENKINLANKSFEIINANVNNEVNDSNMCNTSYEVNQNKPKRKYYALTQKMRQTKKSSKTKSKTIINEKESNNQTKMNIDHLIFDQNIDQFIFDQNDDIITFSQEELEW